MVYQLREDVAQTNQERAPVKDSILIVVEPVIRSVAPGLCTIMVVNTLEVKLLENFGYPLDLR